MKDHETEKYQDANCSKSRFGWGGGGTTAEQKMETWMKSLEDSISANSTGTTSDNQDKTEDWDTTASLTVNLSRIGNGIF